MRVAAFQPYLFPYLGYFKLISDVDVFVVLDDVSFRKRSYINRNTVKVCGLPYMFTVPVKDVSQNRHINQHYYVNDGGLFAKLEGDYGKSRNFIRLRELYESVFRDDNVSRNVAEINYFLIAKVCEFFEIETKIIRSSSLCLESKGECRIVDICKRLDASCYVNPVGGVELYSERSFLKAGLNLEFKDYRKLVTGDIAYSILDGLLSENFYDVSNVLRNRL